MKHLSILLRLSLFGGLLLLISSLQGNINKVEAGCASGYVCTGHTVLDVGAGCKYYSGYCTQKWVSPRPTINCDSNCAGGRWGTACSSSCATSSKYYSTNCCARDDDDDDDGGNGGGGCDWGTKPNVPPSACVQANGLWGHYYRDNPVGEPRFDGGLKMERNDSDINFDWGGGAPSANLCSDNFSTSWTGYVNLSNSGNWRFGTTSDDGFAVDLETFPGRWVRVLSDWSDHSARAFWGAFYNLNAGWYGIRVWFYENSGDAVAKLRFEGPGVSARVITSADLRTCSAPCSTTPPRGLNATAITATSARLNWIPGTGGDKQLIRVDVDQNDVNIGCPGGVGVDPDETSGTKCVVKDDNIPSGQPTYATGSVLTTGTRYYYRVVNFKSGTCYADASSDFVTQSDPWLQALGGDVHANHLVALRVAPVGQNARWLISARGSITGSSQEDWIAQYYPERNFDLTQNTPLKAPDYDTLFQRFGGAALTYIGPSLPNSSGVYLINGNKTVNGVFNQRAGRNTLIFIDGNLTINAEIRTAANGTLAFIVSGTINFSKDLAGGGPADDFAGGLYVAEGRINTAFDKTGPSEVTRQLVVEGALISLRDTVSLDRNLDPAGNLTEPAEQINLTGKYYILLKTVLGRPQFFYREVPAGF